MTYRFSIKLILLFLNFLLTPQLKAAATTKDPRPILIAIIDTGLDLKHPAFKSMIWQNPGETGLDKNGRDKATNNIDDDGNGFIDDVTGWNFVDNSSQVQDLHGHGTHVAGIIAKEARAAPVRFMVLKYYDPKLSGDQHVRNTILAINYANKMGAKIINYSAGGPDFNSEEQKAILASQSKNILFVCAAGNDGQNSDKSPYYPAAYKLSNMISVAAIDREGQLLKSSNFGVDSVDTVALGLDIRSALPGKKYGAMTGTSQATASITGLAALTLHHYPELESAKQLAQHILRTGLHEKNLQGKVRNSTRPNPERALAMGPKSSSTYFEDPLKIRILETNQVSERQN